MMRRSTHFFASCKPSADHLSVPEEHEHAETSPLEIVAGDHLVHRGYGWWVTAAIPATCHGMKAMVLRATWDGEGNDPSLHPGRHLFMHAYETEGALVVAKPEAGDEDLARHVDRLTNPIHRKRGDADSWVQYEGSHYPAITLSQLGKEHQDRVGTMRESILVLDPVTGGTVLSPFALYDDRGNFLRISLGSFGPGESPVRFNPSAKGPEWQSYRYDLHDGRSAHVYFQPRLTDEQEDLARAVCPLGPMTFDAVYANELRPSLHYPYELVYQEPKRLLEVAAFFSQVVGEACGIHPRSLSRLAREALMAAPLEVLVKPEHLGPGEGEIVRAQAMRIAKGTALCPPCLAVWLETSIRPHAGQLTHGKG